MQPCAECSSEDTYLVRMGEDCDDNGYGCNDCGWSEY